MIKHINHPKYERLIAWLKRAREERGLTVRELGGMLGETHQFVNKVETMQRRLNVFEFVQYCEVLGVEPNDGLALLRQTSKGEV
ncbi:helix-turn-helix transcriptional regulator [Neiella sp. HB171785]|uniref:Helix-turn-helix transcriptional regulator n=1 Tax=Neiella litorisoli TaxID=2771431 RepID=A0A8J6QQM1_9GAMM|nr:helix-turn-helix transcriptional regulator [Neiella litorisoli]MBD1388849.1 helix-turn-helix transcriptional regulator [Neiella litorisoli]